MTTDDSPPQNQDSPDSHTTRLPRFLAASRGQAEQIGFILIIVAVLSLFTLAQVTLAPQVQSETEFEHGSQIISDYQNIHSDVLATADTGQSGSSVLHMGSNYPSYLILAHPPDPAGSLTTGEAKPLEISNAEAVNEETAAFVDGSTQQYEHHELRYSPQYNQFDSAGDTVVEQGVAYQDFDSSVELLGSSGVVEGNQISLIASTGDIGIGSQQAKLVETEPLSASQETVIVESDSDPIEIEFETELTEEQWEEILAGEIDESGSVTNDRFVTDVDKSGDTLTLTLQEDGLTGPATYELNLAKVGLKLGEQASFSSSEEPDTGYMTTQQATEAVVQPGDTLEFTVQTRDRYSNPTSNVIVDGITTHPTSDIDAVSRVTRTDGEATFLYEAPSEGEVDGFVDDDVTIYVNEHGLSASPSQTEVENGVPHEERITFEVTIQGEPN